MKSQFLRRIQFCNFYKYFNEKVQLIKVEIFGIKYIHTNSIYDIIQLTGLQIDKRSFEQFVKNYKKFCYTLAGRPLVIETGKVAGLANGSCMISYGETVILACATASAA